MEKQTKNIIWVLKEKFLSMKRTKGIEDFDDLSLSAFYVNALLVQPFTRHEHCSLSRCIHMRCILCAFKLSEYNAKINRVLVVKI